MHGLKGPIALLAILLLVIVIAFALPFFMERMTEEEPFVPRSPPPEVVEQLQKSRGFEALISYTDNGFEPTQVSIKQGQSVRFTNNSSHKLWIAAEAEVGTPSYPGVSECGGSAFDSCRALKHRDFWEFTFGEEGTWLFKNNLDKNKTGTVMVEVL